MKNEKDVVSGQDFSGIEIQRRFNMHFQFFERTVKVFSESDGEYKPAENMLTVSGQVLHTVAALELFASSYFNLFNDFGKDYKGELLSEEHLSSYKMFKDTSWLKISDVANSVSGNSNLPLRKSMAILESTMEAIGKLFSYLTKEQLSRTLGINPIMEPYFNGYDVVEMMLDHTAHHRGGLAQYARIKGYSPFIPYFDLEEVKHEQKLN